MSNPTPIAPDTPRLIDSALSGIQTVLEANLSWLTKAYGRAEKRERLRDSIRILYPAIYCGKNEYLNMLPDDHLGNYCFFHVEDGQSYEWMLRQDGFLTINFGLIFWFDFRTVYPDDYETRTVENVKYDVLRVLQSNNLAPANLGIDQIFDRSENIYQGYTVDEIKNQFLMRPYGGFKLNGMIIYKGTC